MIVEHSKKVTIVEPIPLHTIKSDSKVSFPLYYKKPDKKFEKILEKGGIYSARMKEELSLLNLNDLFININDKTNYSQYVGSYINSLAGDKAMPLREKSLIIYDYAVKVLDELFANPESKEAFAKVTPLVNNTIDVVLSDSASVRSFIEVSSFDYFTHTHSVDVAVHAIAFGVHLNFDAETIRRLGYAAMLHDIGKTRIDSDIIYKKSALDEAEFNKIKRHTIYSYFILKSHREMDKEILDAVKHHHEKYDGSGYPMKLAGGRIPLLAQIISIVDVFSALTTQRPYQKAMSSFEALHLMKTEMAPHFNEILLLEFIKYMGPNA